ncbi:amino acid adenylation domain-containing protein [Nesterenkonia populi]
MSQVTQSESAHDGPQLRGGQPSRDAAPLLPGQLGVWSAEQLQPAADAFLISQIIWFDDEIEPQTLAEAVRITCAETDVIHRRPQTAGAEGTPQLRAAAEQGPRVTVSAEPLADEKIRAEALASCRRRGGSAERFVTRSILHPRAAGGWAWELTTHHLFLDAYGLGLLTRRAAEAYTALDAGEEVPSRWFGSYQALAEAENPGEADAAAEPWAEAFAPMEEEPAVSFDASRRFFLTDQRAQRSISEALSERIDQLARSSRVTWSDVLASAWGLFTAARDGRSTAALRIPRMNRRGRAALTTPGMLVTAAPVVVPADPGGTFEEFLGQTKQAMGASRHQAAADERLAPLWPHGADDYFAIPQINVKAFDYDCRFGEAAGVQETITSGPANRLDLMVYRDAVHGFRLDLASSAEELDAEALQDLLADFQQHLERLLADPETAPLAAVSALGTDQHEQLLQWGMGAEGSSVSGSLDSLLREQAQRSPDARALADDASGDEMTYAEFEARTNRWARALAARGVSVGERVAVMVPRSPELVVVLAAVLRTGAAYVPVDAEHPGQRIAEILEDSEARLLIAGEGTAVPDEAPSIDVVRAGGPDADAALEAHSSEPFTDAERGRPLSAGDTACVLFTSGTTGRPKGVVIAHRMVLNRLLWGERAYPISGGRTLFKTPVTFDVSVAEIFGALCFGGSLVVGADGGHRDPAYLAEVIARHGVDRVNFVPSMAQAFVDHLAGHPETAEGVRGLQWVGLAGEALPTGLARTAAEAVDGEVVNVYGPTEAGEITFHPYAAADSGSAVPVGRPISNARAYVLDAWLRPVPVGVAGELWLAGPQLADGYAGRPGRTAERFVADPVSGDGSRMYRTGDLARWNQSGVLEFLGRADDQVKIRGFRVEVEEVSAVLDAHPSAASSAVLACDHPGGGGKFLAAYIIPAARDQELRGDELKDWAAGRLPDHMVPAVFIPISRFPVTTNGKLDRSRLPAPDIGRLSAGGRALEGHWEQTVAAAFADVLGLPEDASVSAEDDFFARGGHSLLAARLVAQINAQTRIQAEQALELTLREIFESPTVSGLARVLGERSARRSTGGQALPRLSEMRRPAEIPASYGQQSLWLIDQLSTGPQAASRYVVPSIHHLYGDLDPQAMEQALHDVLARHESLRTLLIASQHDDGGTRVLQQILDPEEAAERLRLITEDHTESPAGSACRRIEELISSGFRLSEELLLRAALLAVGEQEWSLALVMHHHAVDEWSLPALLGCLSQAYAARAAGGAPDWQPLPVQYADYALWQRQALGSAEDPDSLLSRQLEHWTQTLSDIPEESTIGLERPRPAQPTHAAAETEFSLEPELTAALRETAESHGVSVFMLAQAATALAASSLGAGDDIVIGSPVGGRTEQGLEETVGYFVNTLPIRHRLSPTATAAQLLDQTRAAVLEAFAHQLTPFEEITRALGVDRSSARNPIFQIMLTHLNTGAAAADQDGYLTLPGISSRSRMHSLGTAKTDVDLYLVESAEGISGLLSTAAEIISPEMAERFLVGLKRAFRALTAAAPQEPLAALQLTEPAPRRSAAATPTAQTADAVLRQQAEESAAAVALIDGQTAELVTYRELAAQADACAALLAARGVQLGDRVAVMLPRSVDLAAAILGTLRAGAAYIPVDPELPQARISEMLDDAGAAAVITAGSVSPDPQVLGERAVLRIDEEPAAQTMRAGRSPAPELPRALAGADAACIIFTSGSTGRPKGVVLSHAGLAHRLAWGRDRLELVPSATSGATALWKSSLGFVDGSTELLTPLGAGAAVVVASGGADRDPARLTRLIRRHRVTHLLTVPSLVEPLTAALRAEEPDSEPCPLRHWVSSGEALTAAAATAMRRAAPRAQIHNFYGSTEVTGDATAEEVSGERPTLGAAVPGVEAHVLDAWLRPVPVGVVGELHLSGSQLAEGYVGRAALTAERFVADPHGSGQRLYRTGDLVRQAESGQLEYLGRADDQVKIRGFRVEIDEIRTVLEAHPQVGSAAVAAAEDSVRGTSLVAYATPAEPAAELDPEALRRDLRGQLPDYMVPSAVMALQSLPINAHGKVDRSALPVPETAASAGGRAPQTASEHRMAGLFAEVLNRDAEGLSAEDDFFALGGHSLLAARLIARITAETQVPLTLRDVFEHPRLESLAAVAEDRGAAEHPSLLQAAEVRRPAQIPASFGQQSLWLIDQLGGAPSLYLVPAAMRLRGPLCAEALEQAVADLVRRHEALRTALVEADGQLVQRVLDPEEAVAQLEMTVRKTTGEQLEDQLSDLLQRRFSLAEEVPVRAALLRQNDDSAVFVLIAHHHVIDEWSLPVLLGELSAAYEARAAGRVPHWEELTAQYADFAVWQRQVLGSADDPESVLHRMLLQWRTALEGAPEESTIAADRPRPAEPQHIGADLPFALEDELVTGLRAAAQRHGMSIFMIVHAAAALAASRLGAGDDVVIGSPMSGRRDASLEGTIGYFVNTVPIRHRIRPQATFAEVLKGAREAVLGAFEHQAAPFEEITRAVGAEHSAARNPLFQIMLTHRVETEPAAPLFPSLEEAERIPVSLRAAKTDLDLYFAETPAGMSGMLSYSTELYDRGTAERFLSVLTGVFEQFAADLEPPAAELDALPAADHERLRRWGTGETLGEPPTTVDEMLRRQQELTPEATALISTAEELTCAQLAGRIDALAQRLAEKGLGRGSRVAVMLPRSANTVIACGAVLRAGCAYVPIDPAYPEERAAYLLRDSGAQALITDEAVAAARPRITRQAGVVTITAETADDAAADPSAPSPQSPMPGDTAVVIYTSGTTGRPKGVEITHAALSRRLQWGRQTLEMGTESTVLWKSAVGFVDGSTELLTPLTAGAQVVIAGAEAAGDPHGLAAAVQQHVVTHLLTVPSLAGALLDSAELLGEHALSSLRHWVSSGEALSARTAAGMQQAAPRARIHNFYGATEVTGEGTHVLLEREADGVRGLVPAIGRPVAGMRAEVLDDWLRPTAPGAVGELYLGGKHLASGYIGDGARTAERFVADPRSTAGERLFRTGDLVRWSSRGELEFLGRSDEQLSIRGFRVEAEEIRTVLESHPTVAAAAVIASEGSGPSAQLLAYCVPAGPGCDAQGWGSGELRSWAQLHLPEHMVPAHIIRVEQIPTTPNGKLDRRALRALGEVKEHPAGREPQTPTEKALADILQEVLELSGDAALSAEDDFFSLGGDSILAARAVTLAARQGMSLTLRDVFERRTAEAIAAALPEPVELTEAQQAAPVKAPAVLDELRASGEEMNSWTQTVRVEVPEGAGAESVGQALAELAAAHEWLRLRVTPKRRRFWLCELLPVAAVQPAATAAGPDEAERLAAAAVDLAAGRPAAAASAPGQAVLAVHRAAAQGEGLQRLAEEFAQLLRRTG